MWKAGIKVVMKIWLDDLRVAPEGYETVKSVNEAIELIEKCEWEGVQAEGTYLIKATGPSGNFVYFYTGSYMPAHNYNSSKFNVYHIQLMWATGIVERNVGQCYPKMLYSIRPVCNK